MPTWSKIVANNAGRGRPSPIHSPPGPPSASPRSGASLDGASACGCRCRSRGAREAGAEPRPRIRHCFAAGAVTLATSRARQVWPSPSRARRRRRGPWRRLRDEPPVAGGNAWLVPDNAPRCWSGEGEDSGLAHVEFLAAEAARLASLPDPVAYEVSAEAFLERLEAREGKHLNSVDLENLVTLSDKAKRRLRLLRVQRRPRGPLSLGLLTLWEVWESRGVPRSVRLHPARPLEVARLHRPSPEQLFEFVLRCQPVVITGALDAVDFPPLRDFEDFGYLRARCGDRVVRVKADAFIDQEGREYFVTDPNLEMPLRDFLARLEASEASGESPLCYMAKCRLNDQVPEMVEDVECAPTSPLGLYGSCFGQNYQGMHTYFGCGSNATSIHCDPGDNLLMVICGTKRFDLFPPTDADCLYPVRRVCSAVPAFTPPGGMPGELKRRCPLYAHLRPIRVDLEKGDMLYLPLFWWHCVAGCVGRNMCLNWWCEMHPSKVQRSHVFEGARAVMAEVRQQLEIPTED